MARRQQQGFGGIISFELSAGIVGVKAFLEGLNCFSLAESLGGVESLVAHPASMTHASMAAEAQACAGITPQLLRLSVGIEATSDLINDVRLGLGRVLALRNTRLKANSKIDLDGVQTTSCAAISNRVSG